MTEQQIIAGFAALPAAAIWCFIAAMLQLRGAHLGRWQPADTTLSSTTFGGMATSYAASILWRAAGELDRSTWATVAAIVAQVTAVLLSRRARRQARPRI